LGRGSPRGRGGRICSGAGLTSRSGGGGGVDLAVQKLGWSSGLLDPEVRSVEVLRRYIGGQGGPVLYDGEQLLRKPCTCGGDSRGESRRGRSGDRGQRARGRSWCPDRAPAVAEVKQGGETTAAWILCTAELGRGRGTRAAAAVWRRGSQEGVTGHLRRGAVVIAAAIRVREERIAQRPGVIRARWGSF